MKSRPVASGQIGYPQQFDSSRDDARGASFLLAHQQLGLLALGTEPTNGQVVPIVINGTTITVTAVTSIGSTANNVLIGGSALAFVTNLVNFLRRPDVTNSNQIAATAPNQQLLSYVGWAWPGSSTNIVAFSLNKNVNDISGPLTSFNITGITVTSGSWTAQTMQLYVEDGTYYINGTRYLFTGGSTPTVTAPSSHPRIDVLTIDDTETLAWTTGTENASPVAPAYPSNQVPICELYNVVSETALYDGENQQSGEGYISNDVRPTIQYGIPFSGVPSDIIPDTTDTRSLGNNSVEWLNIYGKNIYQNGQLAAYSKFGDTGADGALSISSGTTTINLGAAAVVEKNYTSISITGTGKLAFSNPNTNGTVIVLKSQGGVTLTSSAAPMIDASGMGAAAGTNSFHNLSVTVATAGLTASSSTGANGGNAYAWPWAGQVTGKMIQLSTGAGSGAGHNGSGSNGGAGGAGGGALMIECAGAWNFTTSGGISVAGVAGGNSTTSSAGSTGGGGGGGAGGTFYGFYSSLTANTGTVTISGGNGGNGGNATGRNSGGNGGGGGGAGANLASGGAGGTSSNQNSSSAANSGSNGGGTYGGTGGTGGTGGGFFGTGATGDGAGGGGGGGGQGFSFVAQNVDWA